MSGLSMTSKARSTSLSPSLLSPTIIHPPPPPPPPPPSSSVSSPSSSPLLPPTDDEIHLSTFSFPPFPLARGDIPSRLQITDKLYGRQEELAWMRRAFDTVVKTSESIVLCVDGVAGAGKSSSIRQVCRDLTVAYPTCLVVSSKLDQYQRQPIGMFKQLVSEIVVGILTQPTRVLARWRKAVMEAVGSSGILMIDLFPSVLQLIGEQPPVPVLPPAEAQQRLQLVFTAFLCSFCSACRPLLMFLDDVQWSDDNSLSSLEQFAVNPSCANVMIVLAYRKEEMHAMHPLQVATWTRSDKQARQCRPSHVTHCPCSTFNICAATRCTARCLKHRRWPHSWSRELRVIPSLLVNFCCRCIVIVSSLTTPPPHRKRRRRLGEVQQREDRA